MGEKLTIIIIQLKNKLKLITYLIFREWELGFNGTNLVIISKKNGRKFIITKLNIIHKYV